MSRIERPNYLGEEEKVISNLQGENWSLMVTSSRLLYETLSTDGKSRNVQDFDYKHIALIDCESKSGEDYRALGAILAILGLVIVYMGQEYGYGATIIGGLFLISGILLFLQKTEPRTILSIKLSGVNETNKITLAISVSQIDGILRSLSEMREKTTLEPHRVDVLMQKVKEDNNV